MGSKSPAFKGRASPLTRDLCNIRVYTGSFSRFVTSTTVPIATGWNDSCRVGFSPTERTRFSRRTEKFGLVHGAGSLYHEIQIVDDQQNLREDIGRLLIS